MNDPAYERGYLQQGDWLDSSHKSIAEAEDCLAERLASTDRRNSFNRGADDATRDYIIRLKESR